MNRPPERPGGATGLSATHTHPDERGAGPLATNPPASSAPTNGTSLIRVHRGSEPRPGRELRHALAAARRGWHVFPLTPGGKRPLPGFTDWESRATDDPEAIRRLWDGRPYNVGIACGPSRLVVIDLDTPKDGRRPPQPWDVPGVNEGADVLASLCEQAGQPFPFETFQVRTRRGGVHLYFTAPDGVTLGNTSGDRGRGLGWLIDTRATGGYVVGPGSRVDLPDGRGTYDVIHAPDPLPLPRWLADRLAAPSDPPRGPMRPPSEIISGHGARATGYVLAALRGEVQHVLDARPGSRNATLNTAAYALGRLVGGGLLPAHSAETALRMAAESIGRPPREAAATIRSGLAAGSTQSRQGAA
ncbi:bifunctional DNA primase/polymerase [Planomonospora algeriensis]